MIDQWWFHETASGLFSAGWTELWHQGLGVGLIILLAVLAFVLKSKWLAGAAVVCAIGLAIYSYGHHDEARVCEAKVKKIYLQAHPLLTKRNTAAHWKIAPSWNPGAPPIYKPLTCDGPFDTNCWGQY